MMRRASTGAIPRQRLSDGNDGDDVFDAAPVEILPKEINLSGDADEKLPNTLVVTVLQARNLHTAALRSTLSCYVKLSSLGREYKTSVISKSDEPYWNETFSFRAVDWAASVTLSVRDKINLKMRFLGQARISCTDIAALPGMATQSWFRLRDKNWERKPGMDSELELKIALVYTKRNDPNLAKDFAAIAGVDMDDEVVGVVADQDDETEEEALARRQELERLESERKNTLFTNLRQGDYQVQIHVIEARDLKGENLSGTSDPYVQAEVMGLKKKTSTKYETLGCVFDEVLFFHVKNIGRNELRQASIKLSVYDKETVLKDKLIGTYQLDYLSVYFRPHHELYRQWVAVHDHLNEKDRGIQGFLLVSITVIGPGDTFRVHDREAEIAQELAAAAAVAAQASDTSGSGSSSATFSTATLAALNPEGQSLVLLPPTIELKLHYLVVKVFKAEDLPAMDQGGLIVASGIDAFVQIGFGANAACRSSVVTVKGASHLAPEFLEELWIPVMAPTLCRHISISVWDRDLGRKDELVGITSHDYHRVVSADAPGGMYAKPGAVSAAEARHQRELELPDRADTAAAGTGEDEVALRWFNLYGPPLKRTNKKRAMWIAQNPDWGSTYRGRLLLSMERVEGPVPEASEKFHLKRMKETTLAVVEPRLPKTLKYVLRCALFCGTDMPMFSSGLAGPSSTSTKLRVTVSIGPHELQFESLSVGKDGRINWEECKEKWPMILPADLTQLPDIVVTLSRQVDKETFVSVSYARFVAADYFQEAFNGKSQWIQLREEVARRQTRYALDKSQAPGSLLLRLGFGREEVAVRTPWGDEAALFSSFRHHRVYREVRVHVFQFRRLLLPEAKVKPPNPFVSVRCCGQVKKTACKFKTLDPLFYETLVFTAQVPHDVAYSPDLVFHVHDANVSSSSSAAHIPGAILGELRIPMSMAQRAVANASPARPTWHALTSRTSGASGEQHSLFIDEPHGEALISVQYVDHQGPIQTLYPQDPRALIPEYAEANLEIIALGVRKLKSRSSLLGIRNPQVEFELTGGVFADGTNVRSSRPAVPTTGRNGKNANLLERLMLPAKLPVDTLYAPQLNIRVLEVTMGGLRKTLIASSVVDLASKMPWSASFVPQYHQQAVFENPNTVSALTTADADGDKNKKRRKALLDVLSRSRVHRSSRSAVPPADSTGDPLRTDDDAGGFSDDDDDGAHVVEAIPIAEPDDGMGVGSLPRSVQPALWTMPSTSTTPDPAVQDQLAREEHRRYAAGQSDLLRGGSGGGVYKLASGVHRHQQGSEAPREALQSAGGSGSLSYLTGRDWWISQGGEELEKYLQSKALETYPLYRSVLTRPSLLKRKRVRVLVKAGIFKGMIAVTERHKKSTSSPTASAIDLDRLKEPQAVVVRVYVLRGCNLQAKDLNGFSDPYLRLKLGKEIQSDRAHHKKKTLNPDFFKVFTFNTTLPGASQLEIGVWDHDLIVRDDFIGSTTIDLEDRWFHREWQRLTGPNGSEPLKPIENRHLFTPKRTTSQGLLQVWVDILTAQQAALVPPTSIAPPAPKKFEIRVIVWRAENVTDKDESELNDYFVKVWMEGGKAENTDVHWRCANGKPCWNWRFKLSAEYPLRSAEFARLHIQLWDKDVVKWNDVIGEAQLDLYKWLRRAYETDRAVAPFLELKKLSKNRLEVPETERQGDISGRGDEQETDDDEDDDEESNDDDGDDVVERGYGTKENATLLQRNQGAKKKRPVNLKINSKKPKFLDKDAQKRSKDAKRKTKEARESNEARLALNGLLDFIGMGSLPDEAEWVTIYYTDRESAVSMDMGRIGISVEIVPEKEAQINPVGKGQEAPNVNPYLPPPVGRMRLTANPFMMVRELIGPKMCIRLALACCCIGCVMFVGVFGATIMSTLTFIQEFERSNEPHASGAFVLPEWPYAFNATSMTNSSVAAPRNVSTRLPTTRPAANATRPTGQEDHPL